MIAFRSGKRPAIDVVEQSARFMWKACLFTLSHKHKHNLPAPMHGVCHQTNDKVSPKNVDCLPSMHSTDEEKSLTWYVSLCMHVRVCLCYVTPYAEKHILSKALTKQCLCYTTSEKHEKRFLVWQICNSSERQSWCGSCTDFFVFPNYFHMLMPLSPEYPSSITMPTGGFIGTMPKANVCKRLNSYGMRATQSDQYCQYKFNPPPTTITWTVCAGRQNCWNTWQTSTNCNHFNWVWSLVSFVEYFVHQLYWNKSSSSVAKQVALFAKDVQCLFYQFGLSTTRISILSSFSTHLYPLGFYSGFISKSDGLQQTR